MFSLRYPIPESLRTLGVVVMTTLCHFEITLGVVIKLSTPDLLAHTLDLAQVFNASTLHNNLPSSKRHHILSRGPSAG